MKGPVTLRLALWATLYPPQNISESQLTPAIVAASAKFPAALPAENMSVSNSPDAVPGEEFEYVSFLRALHDVWMKINSGADMKLYPQTMAWDTTCLQAHSQALRYEK